MLIIEFCAWLNVKRGTVSKKRDTPSSNCLENVAQLLLCSAKVANYKKERNEATILEISRNCLLNLPILELKPTNSKINALFLETSRKSFKTIELFQDEPVYIF